MDHHFRFELTGKTPLIMHRDDVLSADEVGAFRDEAKKRKQGGAGDDRFPAWTWLTYLYPSEEFVDPKTGRREPSVVSIPSPNLMSCLKWAGNRIHRGRKSLKEVTQTSLLIWTDYASLVGPEGVVPMKDVYALKDLPFSGQKEEASRLGITLDVRRAKLNSSKHIRVRPRFETWRCEGKIEITDPDSLSESELRGLFDIAGQYIGLGDWRPSSPKSPGIYGRFHAELTK